MARSRPLSDTVFDRIATGIIAGEMAATAPLPTEPQLCESFGVSRTVVREAMARLAAAGLVRIRQGSGTIALPRSDWNDLHPDVLRVRAETGLIADLVPDLLAVRRLVEVEAAGLAALHRSAEDLAELNRQYERMAAATADPVLYNDADIAFHECLLTASGNELLAQMMRPVHQVRRIGSLFTSRDWSVVSSSLAGHRTILDAVRDGDREAARAAMSGHISQFERDLSNLALARTPESAGAMSR